ncbi:restriction endonuclease subunit S [Pantoea agglomerans]|uniref:restriction endonuclease subunit S n=1 Tax=Enterobacter agglomerans TaxID=549 RepID=UPI000E20CA20|nr:restriction endonuclease subunit S [Pantoea agglomerans]MBD8133376.1 restriction endonuclease subunit S [Pantoea agglomerans]
MSKLTKYKFSDLYSMSSGISSTKEQAGHGSPFLSFSVVFNNYFVPDVLNDLMDTSEKEKETYSVKCGDIFLTRTSEVVDELAMSCVAVKDYPNATFSGFLKRLRPTQDNITYPKFMAFYLRSPMFRKTMTNNAVMTLRASLNEAIFSYLHLLLPAYSEQKKAGDFLYLLNQKIALNNRINAELEAMAKTLYDYWFVQFDFPDTTGKPYKTSGGKMVYNATLRQEIPAGWSVDTLSGWIADDKTGDWGKENREGNYTIQVNCIRGADINGLNGYGNTSMPVRYILGKNEKKLLSAYDCVIEISGGSPTQSTGRMAFITKEMLDRFSHPVICSNFCKAITLKDNLYFYNFAYTWNNIYNKGLLFGWEGKTSGIKNLLFDSFVDKYYACIPHKDLVKKFHDIMVPLHQKKQKNLKENADLVKFRDWLIPLLMNGQVTAE